MLGAWLPTVVFSKTSDGGETTSGGPLPSGGAARLEAGAARRARTNAETAISLVMPHHRKLVQAALTLDGIVHPYPSFGEPAPRRPSAQCSASSRSRWLSV